MLLFYRNEEKLSKQMTTAQATTSTTDSLSLFSKIINAGGEGKPTIKTSFDG